MVFPAPRHVVITGAPGAGKTSLLNELETRGLRVSHEVARTLLKIRGGMELRERNPVGFAEAMMEAHTREYEAAQATGDLVIFDRGFPDVAGFLQVSGLPVPSGIDSVCRSLRYDGPIFRARAWAEIYAQDAQRIQNWEEAVTSDEAVATAWRGYGYRLIDLPFSSIEERADFIVKTIG